MRTKCMKESGLLTIGKPRIEYFDKKARIVSNIDINGFSKELYFEFDKKYSDFVVLDRVDVFVLALLHNCMFENYKIKSDFPISSRLKFQLINFYIPIISKNMSDMNLIQIDVPTTDSRISSKGFAMTGISGGVDSFYAVLKGMNYSDGFLLKYLFYNNISTEDFDENRIVENFKKDLIEKEKISKELGLDLIWVYSNLYSFYKHPGIFNYYYAAQYISAALLFNKLITVYYFASGNPAEHFSLNEAKISDGSDFDILSLKCFSTDFFTIYNVGAEAHRNDKTEFILKNKVVQRHLKTCSVEQRSGGGHINGDYLNCGHCNKCMRTILTIYAYGELDNYSNIYDLSYFEKDKARFVGKYLATDHKEFSLFVKKLLKSKKKMPKFYEIWYIIYSFRYLLARSKLLRKILKK